ncbi:uncharacterized protein LOC118151365 [Callithrix jacchus]
MRGGRLSSANARRKPGVGACTCRLRSPRPPAGSGLEGAWTPRCRAHTARVGRTPRGGLGGTEGRGGRPESLSRPPETPPRPAPRPRTLSAPTAAAQVGPARSGRRCSGAPRRTCDCGSASDSWTLGISLFCGQQRSIWKCGFDSSSARSLRAAILSCSYRAILNQVPGEDLLASERKKTTVHVQSPQCSFGGWSPEETQMSLGTPPVGWGQALLTPAGLPAWTLWNCSTRFSAAAWGQESGQYQDSGQEGCRGTLQALKAQSIDCHDETRSLRRMIREGKREKARARGAHESEGERQEEGDNYVLMVVCTLGLFHICSSSFRMLGAAAVMGRPWEGKGRVRLEEALGPCCPEAAEPTPQAPVCSSPDPSPQPGSLPTVREEPLSSHTLSQPSHPVTAQAGKAKAVSSHSSKRQPPSPGRCAQYVIPSLLL